LKIFPENTTEKLGLTAILEATLEKVHGPLSREVIEALAPMSDRIAVESALDRTSEAMRLMRSGDPLPIGDMPDVRNALNRARPEGSVLDPTSLLHIGQLLVMSRRIRQYFDQRDELYPNWTEFCHPIQPLKALEEAIFSVLTEQGAIRDNASPELQTIRRNLNSRKNDLRTTLNRILRQASKDGYLSEQEPTIRSGRMVLAVKAEHKRKVSGFVHDESATGQTVYLEPVEALHINNDIRQLESEEAREIERILRTLTGKIRWELDAIRINVQHLAQIDAGLAIARMSIDLDGVIPEISERVSTKNNGNYTDRRPVHIVRGYNPHLLLRAIRESNISSIVPLDLTMETNERCLVITGPNAGGKSVALKTLGLLALMVQCGYAVPVREGSRIPVFGSIFVDMGDEQSIENDLSTFSSRLTWMRKTAIQAGSDSLVLIDEAGTGTDPEEGVALYQSLIELLIDQGSLSVVTTHHGNLKVFAHNHPAAVNASMEFDQTTLSPTYRFRKGLPGSSYAFEIAQRIGVPGGVLSRARELIGDSRNRLEQLIAAIEKESQQTESIRLEAQKQLTEANKLIAGYQEKMEHLTRERDKIREKALIEAREIMQGANKRIEDAVRRITEEKAGKSDLKEIRKDVDRAQTQINQELEKVNEKRAPKALGTPPAVGDTVRMIDGSTTGELVEVNGNQAVVLASGLRLKTKYKNLVKVMATSSKKKDRGGVVVLSSGDDPDDGIIRVVSSTLDLRGKRGNEAVQELMYFLDKLVVSGLSQAEVIHGKGDGILRKLVHEYLQGRKEVKSFNLAPWEQGGPGCTLLHLKG
jgi:DNA mismatch repair protein MutS2